jgi:hypothetical protein
MPIQARTVQCSVAVRAAIVDAEAVLTVLPSGSSHAMEVFFLVWGNDMHDGGGPVEGWPAM